MILLPFQKSLVCLKSFCRRLRPAISCLRRSDRCARSSRSGRLRRSSPTLFAGASGVSLRDCRKPALPEPASRENLRAACSADNPAIHPMHKWNRHRPPAITSVPALNDSCRVDASFPTAPGIRRVTASTITAAPNSPPLSTKSPMEISRSARCCADALVHTFVAAADQDQPFECRKFCGQALIEAAALRREQHDTLLGRLPRAFRAALDVQPSIHSKIGSGFSTMPSPPPKGRSSTVRCRSCANARKIVDFDFRQASFPGLADNAVIQRSAKKIRKDRQNVDLHRRLFNPCCSTAPTLRLFLLLLFFLCGQRCTQLQHAFRQVHANLFVFEIRAG